MKTSSARLRMVAFSAVILAVLPYVTLKVMWLMGSTLGLTPDWQAITCKTPAW